MPHCTLDGRYFSDSGDDILPSGAQKVLCCTLDGRSLSDSGDDLSSSARVTLCCTLDAKGPGDSVNLGPLLRRNTKSVVILCLARKAQTLTHQ